MATNLEYIYLLKDRYSKKLAKITRTQVAFSQQYAKSMGKVNGALVANQKIMGKTIRQYKNKRKEMEKSKTSIHQMKAAQKQYATVTLSYTQKLIQKQAQYNRMVSQGQSVFNRLPRSPGVGVRGGARGGAGTGSALTQLQSVTGGILGSIFSLRNAMMGLAGAYAGSKLLSLPIGQAAFLEDKLISYKVLFQGNAKLAEDFVKKLNILGAKTPFEFKDLADATNLMIGFGAATEENAIKKVKVLGDISQGDPFKLKLITLAYSQIHSLGRALGNDMRQLANAGVPMKELAKGMGMTLEKMQKMQSQGKLTAAMIDRGFKSMTSKGGIFYKMMDEKSRTLTGRMSTLKDEINLTAQAFGAQLLPFTKKIVDRFIRIAGSVREWVEANKGIIGAEARRWYEWFGQKIDWIEENFDDLLSTVKRVAYTVGVLFALNTIAKIGLMSKEIITLGRMFGGLTKKIWGTVAAKKALDTPGGVGGFGGKVGKFGKMSRGEKMAKFGKAGIAAAGVWGLYEATKGTLDGGTGFWKDIGNSISKAHDFISGALDMSGLSFGYDTRELAKLQPGYKANSGSNSDAAKSAQAKTAMHYSSYVNGMMQGNIKVQAEPGTKVVSQEFEYDLGSNIAGAF